MQLHRRMSDATWRWAGRFRRPDKNIGVQWATSRVTLKHRLADVRHRIAEDILSEGGIATLLHQTSATLLLFVRA